MKTDGAKDNVSRAGAGLEGGDGKSEQREPYGTPRTLQPSAEKRETVTVKRSRRTGWGVEQVPGAPGVRGSARERQGAPGWVVVPPSLGLFSSPGALPHACELSLLCRTFSSPPRSSYSSNCMLEPSDRLFPPDHLLSTPFSETHLFLSRSL